MEARTIGKYFIVTRKLSKDGYLLSDKEVLDMLEELYSMAQVDNMELISTFVTENNTLYLTFKDKER
jgi:hypothetical protein